MPWRNIQDDTFDAAVKFDPVTDLKRLVEAYRDPAEEVT